MFEVDMRERGDGSVTLDNQCPVAVGSFLDFAYSGETLITDSNVDTLFQLASFLQVEMQSILVILNIDQLKAKQRSNTVTYHVWVQRAFLVEKHRVGSFTD